MDVQALSYNVSEVSNSSWVHSHLEPLLLPSRVGSVLSYDSILSISGNITSVVSWGSDRHGHSSVLERSDGS